MPKAIPPALIAHDLPSSDWNARHPLAVFERVVEAVMTTHHSIRLSRFHPRWAG